MPFAGKQSQVKPSPVQNSALQHSQEVPPVDCIDICLEIVLAEPWLVEALIEASLRNGEWLAEYGESQGCGEKIAATTRSMSSYKSAR